VGSWRWRRKLDRQQVGVGDAVTVTLTISGQGNLRKLAPPKLPPLDGFRSYDPKVDVQLTGSERVSGQQGRSNTCCYPSDRDRHRAVHRAGVFRPGHPPLRAGPHRPPAHRGDRGGGPGGGGGPTGGVGGAAVENVLAAEIRPPRSRAALSRDLGTTLYRSPGFLWAVLLPPLAFAATALVDRFRRRMGQDTEGSRRREARRQVRRHLRAAEGQLGGTPARSTWRSIAC
jgi:hypothetical protein